MADLIALSELDAVNLMLETIGEQPVNSLISTGLEDVQIAVQLLNNTSRNIQTAGWTFNRSVNYLLRMNEENEILLPPDILKITPMSSLHVIQRGNRLFDNTNHSFIFDRDITCDITWFLPFENLPQAARTYIYTTASRDFQKKVLGSETLTTITAEDIMQARRLFLEAEDDSGQYNIFDSYDTARPVRRNQNPIGRR